jgi:hypothetical protein
MLHSEWWPTSRNQSLEQNQLERKSLDCVPTPFNS